MGGHGNIVIPEGFTLLDANIALRQLALELARAARVCRHGLSPRRGPRALAEAEPPTS